MSKRDVDLQWNLGDGSTANVADAPESEVIPPGRRRPNWIFLGLYVVALVAAAYVGFLLGRSAEAMAGFEDGILNQIAIEQLAWREGDLALYKSTLHPDADDAWREAQLETFSAYSPISLELRTSTMAVVTPFRVEVTVVLEDPFQSAIDRRVYEVSGNGWYRRSSDLESAVSPRP